MSNNASAWIHVADLQAQAYTIDFVSSKDLDGTVASTPTGRTFQLPLPALLHQGHSFGSQETASILASYLAMVLQLPYTALFYPASSSPLALPSSNAIEASMVRSIDQRLEDRRQIPYTRNLRLVFSLINEDVTAAAGTAHNMQKKDMPGVKGWDGKEVEDLFRKRFGPLLSALRGVHNVDRELQTTWYAPLQFQPKLLEVRREVVNATSPVEEEQLLDEQGAGWADEDEAEVEDLEQLRAVPPAPPPVDRVHVIDWEDIKIFVNSGEWSLSSGAATSPLSSVNASAGINNDVEEMSEQNEKTLHFVLYVPKPSHRPLRIAGNEEGTLVSNATGWLIPQWGGVSLLNLGHEGAESQAIPGKAGLLDSLSESEMDRAFATFEKQFGTLLGLQEVSDLHESVSLALKLDALMRRRVVEASRESVKTLASIIRLVDKIENLGVGESVRGDVSRALALLAQVSFMSCQGRMYSAHPPAILQAAEMMDTTAFDTHTTLPALGSLQPLQATLHLAYSSELLSSRAFFNPNMLGQLYFPDEHKYAVYTPLFGPLAVPLLVAALRLIKERRAAKALREAKDE